MSQNKSFLLVLRKPLYENQKVTTIELRESQAKKSIKANTDDSLQLTFQKLDSAVLKYNFPCHLVLCYPNVSPDRDQLFHSYQQGEGHFPESKFCKVSIVVFM